MIYCLSKAHESQISNLYFNTVKIHQVFCYIWSINYITIFNNNKYISKESNELGLIICTVTQSHNWVNSEAANVSLPKFGQCFWLVVPLEKFASTNQKHYPDRGSDTSSVWNFCSRSSDVIKELKQLRRRQLPKILNLMINRKSARASRFLVYFFDAHCMTTTWNLLIWRFMKDVDIRRRIFLPLFELE